MKRILVPCLVFFVLVGMTFSVTAADAGRITLDFTQFKDQMELVNQLERPSYGIETVRPVKSTEFTSMNIKIVKVEDGNESTCLESNITSLENITINLDPGTYKVYTQLEGDDTVLEYNNDSEGYVLTPQGNLVIPMKYSPIWEGYILDVPWRIENSEINISILAVDTGVDWADIYNITVHDHNNGDSLVASTNWESLQLINSSNTPFFYLFNIEKNSFVQVDGKISIRIKFELHWSPDNWEGPITVRISLDDIPKITDWYCGDTHLHTNYTSNAYEFGAPIYATRAANSALGLDWMIVTDHSFDLDPDKWNVSSAECDAHSDNLFRVLQGEEVSCYLPGTSPTQYNHLLVYGADFILGGEWEDGTGSNYTPTEAIAIANAHGGITYPAHPFYADQFRDPWRDEDYDLPFTGLQIWNHLSDEPTHLPDGLAKWRELLLGGRHVYVEGGTDAHGDFNTIAGKVKTYVYTETFTEDSILDALRNGHSIMTDGPLVIFDINGVGIGENVTLTKGTNATLRVQWNSTPEFGYLNNIMVKRGVINETNETTYNSSSPETMGKNNLSDDYNLTIAPNESCYYRIEAYSNTTNGEQYRCYTNPIWMNVVNDTTSPVVTITYPQNDSVIAVSNVTVTGYATDDVGIVKICFAHDWENLTIGGCNFFDGNTTVPINWTIQLHEGLNRITVTAYDAAGNSGNASMIVTEIKRRFDTCNGTYPSIFGMHNGTITPSCNITFSRLYTYPCPGTGGHTEYAAISYSNGTIIAEAHWHGYMGDWHNITFNKSFTLYENETYNYTIRTGSYPQIIHAESKNVTGGTITCTSFEDANGKVHTGWIPAIGLE
ncbi:MAG TPA: CehA/McbA family metallohydrolase [Candidatus Bathyarchaeia archaeon]|nr:CehA/McbA family metallohydrolase [Candidatus Bathyarchaeia archaeon]